MKELSIEEKAKAYDKVREKIKVRFGTNVAEEIFSEFEESEDEKIRKKIIALFKGQIPYTSKEDNEKFIAWLEKQKTSEEALQYLKENHSPSEVSDFQAAMNIAVAKAYDKGIKDGLEKQGEKPIGIRSRHTTGKLAEIIKDIESADKIEALRTEYEKGRADAIAEMQVAWSDEDEVELNGLIKHYEDGHVSTPQNRKTIKWLKSLKDRVQPKSQWKPSDEQIEALIWQTSNTYQGSWQYKASKELLEQLKKLREDKL